MLARGRRRRRTEEETRRRRGETEVEAHRRWRCQWIVKRAAMGEVV
jgi:hypothetical protein